MYGLYLKCIIQKLSNFNFLILKHSHMFFIFIFNILLMNIHYEVFGSIYNKTVLFRKKSNFFFQNCNYEALGLPF